MDIQYLLDDYKLIERTTPDYNIIVYLDDYLYLIGTRLNNISNITESMRSKALFKPEIDLSPNRKKIIRNIIETLQTFPREHYFYQPTKTVPDPLKPYFIELMYVTIQDLTPNKVLNKIEETRGRESLFMQYYNNTINLNSNIINNKLSINFIYNGTPITLGLNGITLNDFYTKGNDNNLKTIWLQPKKIKNYLNYNLKSIGGEQIGSSYFMRDFRIPSNQYSKAMIKQPYGKTNYPDYVLDTTKINSETKQFIFDTIKRPYSNFIFIDVKATTRSNARKGSGNERLRYPKAKYITNKFLELGIINNKNNLFNLLDPLDYTPIKFNYEQFILILKFWINNNDIFNLLSESTVNLIYQEIGSNVSTRAKYYTIDYNPEDNFTLIKRSNSLYYIYRNKDLIVSLSFYLNLQLHPITPDMMNIASKDPKNKNPDGTFNQSKILQSQLPLDDWSFMWRWNSNGLRLIELPEYKATLSKIL
jgi:hypothetical protein